ncbi:MAG: LysR family transcriptional regulator [Lachnospiraceae bacterium]|nr:LysR family transcriptional regulator [Lachnospiraceae bacterium]
MELKTLQNFLTIAREENMTKAADILHITQPTLSRQIKSLEDELGQKLFIRHSFHIELTEAGILLRKQAEDLLSMANKITDSFQSLDDISGGDLYFGLAESYQIGFLAEFIKDFKIKYPNLKYHITSGDTEQVLEKLEKGILDFAAIVEKPDFNKYNVVSFPEADKWVAVVSSSHRLASKSFITPKDLIGVPLFCSDQSWEKDIPGWAGRLFSELTLEGSFRLSYNGSLFAKKGLGCLLTFDKLIDTSEGSGLKAIPLSPALLTPMYLIWKKQQVFSPIAERFIYEFQNLNEG